MTKKAYFQNVPNIGDLNLLHTLFEYDNIPILFICSDKNNKLYLCLCTDSMFHYCCMIREATIKDIMNVIQDKISMYQAFEQTHTPITIVNYINGHYEYDIKMFGEISEEDLPDKDECLEMNKTRRQKVINNLIEFSSVDSLGFTPSTIRITVQESFEPDVNAVSRFLTIHSAESKSFDTVITNMGYVNTNEMKVLPKTVNITFQNVEIISTDCLAA